MAVFRCRTDYLKRGIVYGGHPLRFVLVFRESHLQKRFKRRP